jgi:hypothetical protein
VRLVQNGPDQFTMDSTVELKFVESMMSYKKMEVADRSDVQLDITEKLWVVITAMRAQGTSDQTLLELVACKTAALTISFISIMDIARSVNHTTSLLDGFLLRESMR